MPRMLWRDCLTQKEFEAYGFSPKDIERQEIMFEIIHTEADYVQDLVLIREVFIKPLRHLHVLSEEEIQELFANIEEILPIHECIKKSLLQRQQDQYPVLEGVADVLLPWVPALYVYARYLCNQTRALRLMNQLLQSNDKFNHFFKERYSRSECRGLAMDAFLILPFQRLLKYPLFLKHLVQATPANHPDYEMAQGVIIQFDALIGKIQRDKLHADRVDALQHLGTWIKGLDVYPLVHPQRHIVKEGLLCQVKTQPLPPSRLHPGTMEFRVMPNQLTPVYMLIMTDLVVLARPRSRRSSGLAAIPFGKHDAGDMGETTAANLGALLAETDAGKPLSELACSECPKASGPKYSLMCPPGSLSSAHPIEPKEDSALSHAFRCYISCQGRSQLFVFRCTNADECRQWVEMINEVSLKHAAAAALKWDAQAGSTAVAAEASAALSSQPDKHALNWPVKPKSRPLSLASNLTPKWFEPSVGDTKPVGLRISPQKTTGDLRPAPATSTAAISEPLSGPVGSGEGRGRTRAVSCVDLMHAPHDMAMPASPTRGKPTSPTINPHSPAANGIGCASSPRRPDKKVAKSNTFLPFSVKKWKLPTSDAYALRKFRKQLHDYGRKDKPTTDGHSRRTDSAVTLTHGNAPGSKDRATDVLQRSSSQLHVRPLSVQVQSALSPRYKRSQSVVEATHGPIVQLVLDKSSIQPLTALATPTAPSLTNNYVPVDLAAKKPPTPTPSTPRRTPTIVESRNVTTPLPASMARIRPLPRVASNPVLPASPVFRPIHPSSADAVTPTRTEYLMRSDASDGASVHSDSVVSSPFSSSLTVTQEPLSGSCRSSGRSTPSTPPAPTTGLKVARCVVPAYSCHTEPVSGEAILHDDFYASRVFAKGLQGYARMQHPRSFDLPDPSSHTYTRSDAQPFSLDTISSHSLPVADSSSTASLHQLSASYLHRPAGRSKPLPVPPIDKVGPGKPASPFASATTLLELNHCVNYYGNKGHGPNPNPGKPLSHATP
ncbi:hypothetical protein H4R34_000743 [Dimargaris verticillata]|uniref:DH domain-containing protein n=1 Tax=Dimargaris verticillata TaxID=2761393 RepID=A0A9W8B642_9FUNG|nr:hypothetical protein H4R34_000743 [Dimargaris verticillata]